MFYISNLFIYLIFINHIFLIWLVYLMLGWISIDPYFFFF